MSLKLSFLNKCIENLCKIISRKKNGASYQNFARGKKCLILVPLSKKKIKKNKKFQERWIDLEKIKIKKLNFFLPPPPPSSPLKMADLKGAGPSQ